MLRDGLMCRVNHSGTQCKLLSEGELIYASTLKLAQTIEAAEKDAPKLSLWWSPSCSFNVDTKTLNVILQGKGSSSMGV